MDGLRVELLKRVGRSGSAELLRGRLVGPQGFSRPALIKRLSPAHAQDPRQVERLRTEALLTAHITHPNVLPVLGVVQLDRGELGVAWADARVTDLQRILEICATQRKRLPARVILGIGWLIADALAAAHVAADARLGLAGIAHGDLSPSNVLVDERGRILLVDFGIGLPPAADGAVPLARLGRLHGKPGYMSPEVVVRGVIGPRSDFFALGTLLWEMLTLRRLFVGKDATETLRNVAVAQVDERFARHPEIPPFVQDILKRALRRAPEERYRDARELQQALLASHPQGFFAIEDELADIIAELAPIPPDAPLELDLNTVTSRPRTKSRLTPRMILLVHHDDGRIESQDEHEHDEAGADAWSEAETPEVLGVLDGSPGVLPLELASAVGDAVVAPPPLPPESLEPPPLPPPSELDAG